MPSGEITATSPVDPDVDLEMAIRALTGDIAQVPSAVSAIKIDGKRSYARVRGGEQVALAPRPVTVSRFGAGRREAVVVDGIPMLDVEVDIRNDRHRPEGLVDASEIDLSHGFLSGNYLTAPKVRPRTSCFWLNQPMIRTGARAMVEAAESFA